MLSNGDLDGDTYLAIWDDEMTRHVRPQQCFEIDDQGSDSILNDCFTSDKLFDIFYTSKFGKPTDSNNIQEFLTWYFSRDNVGKVNNLHLAYCDLLGS